MDLAAAESDPAQWRFHADIAVQHARFAGRIKLRHQFTKATLGRMLFGRMEVFGVTSATALTEAINAMGDAISIERDRHRSTVHPFMTLFTGVSNALGLGPVLSPDQRQTVRSRSKKAIEIFPRDTELKEQAVHVRRLL